MRKFLAIIFAAVTLVYSLLWMFYMRVSQRLEIGADFHYAQPAPNLHVSVVRSGTSARRAGLLEGDRIEAVNNRPVERPEDLQPILAAPGTTVRLEVTRPDGSHAFRTWRLDERRRPSMAWYYRIPQEIINTFPVLFLFVGFGVLFLRPDDRHAWLLALLSAAFIAGPAISAFEWLLPAGQRGFMAAYRTTFYGMSMAFLYAFFAVFPSPSPIDRRVPWLKFAVLGASAAIAVPLGVACFVMRGSMPVEFVSNYLGTAWTSIIEALYFAGLGTLAMVSLAWNGLRTPSREARRRIDVLVWGTVAGFTPLLLSLGVSYYTGRAITDLPSPLWMPAVILAMLAPLSWAYAVVKHQVLPVPVLLRRSVRYVLVQRGMVIIETVVLLLATVTFVVTFSRLFQPRAEVAVPIGVLVGVGFGILLASASTHIEQRVTRRLDRAFFRSAYDAAHILEELAVRTGSAQDRGELASLLDHSLRQALQPEWLAVYIAEQDGDLHIASLTPAEVAAASPVHSLDELPPGDYTVPLPARDGHAVGAIVLGPRKSEESYSGDDKRLLASVAGQAALAVESILLGEKIAERRQAERRLAAELDVATRVQTELFPQDTPVLQTLDYCGRCIQARAIGGDYYDFVPLGENRLGLLLADICGKGIGAALLMANLQAHLRGQYARAAIDLNEMLNEVNRLFGASTPTASFATMFFGIYDDSTRQLVYANCGHNAPLLLRSDRKVEWLTATTTVLGLFAEWQCSTGTVALNPGDTLVIFSDGLPDAESDDGVSFGDERIASTTIAHAHLPAPALLDTIVTTVQEFTGQEREDDLTLVVAKAR